MRTDDGAKGGVALFLFAHQDDEFGVYHTIEQCIARQMRVQCAFFTRGAPAVAAQRNAESLRVLARLGVPEHAVAFAGDELKIDDASLPAHLEAAQQWLINWAGQFAPVKLICVPAWEGGHHDHDALHVLAIGMAEQLGLPATLRQFSLYNRLNRRGPFFNVLLPLKANGEVESSTIAWRKRLQYLRLCLSYPSQRRTWMGLFPFVLLHYLMHGTQALQAVDPLRIVQRPHPGLLYYEYRQFDQWERMEQRLKAWRERRVTRQAT